MSAPNGFASDALAGQVALVTGGGSGIGEAISLTLAAAGASVAIVDVDRAGAERVASAVRDLGARSMALTADLADTAALPAVVDDVVSALGPIDILVNNAGIVTGEALMATGDESWARHFAVNLTAPWKLIQVVGRQMIERSAPGRIVNISSSSGFRAQMSAGAYGVSKAALAALSRSAAAELGPHGINVNTVAPGVTATPLVARSLGDDDVQRQAVSSGPLENLLHRISIPADVANVVVFLCLPASRQITAQTVHTSAGAVI